MKPNPNQPEVSDYAMSLITSTAVSFLAGALAESAVDEIESNFVDLSHRAMVCNIAMATTVLADELMEAIPPPPVDPTNPLPISQEFFASLSKDLRMMVNLRSIPPEVRKFLLSVFKSSKPDPKKVRRFLELVRETKEMDATQTREEQE